MSKISKKKVKLARNPSFFKSSSLISYPLNFKTNPKDTKYESMKYEENIRTSQILQKSVKRNGSKAMVSSKCSSDSIRDPSIKTYFAALSVATSFLISTFWL